MTIQTTAQTGIHNLDAARIPGAVEGNESKDLQQLVDFFLNWWGDILLISGLLAFLVGLGIFLSDLLMAPVYQATADIAIVRTSSDVSFDERFRTTTAGDDSATDAVSASARRNTFFGLVTTGSIAQLVAQELGDLLDEEEKQPANLVNMITAEAGPGISSNRTESDLIRITATASTPEKAAAIANAWAETYVRHVNTVYGQVPDELLASIDQELASAQQTYLESQTALEAFITENQVDELTNLVTLLQRQINQESTLVQSYWDRWQQTNEQLNNANALRVQIEQGGSGAARSTMMALQALKLTVYGMPSVALPAASYQIELRDLPEVGQEAMVTDVDALIRSLQEKLNSLEAEIAARSSQFRTGADGSPASLTPTTPTFIETYAEVRELSAKIEAQNAQKQQLEQQRNVNWETYKALQSKVAELKLLRAAAGSEVRFAASATPPTEPIDLFSTLLGAAVAGVVGFFIALFYALLGNYLGRRPVTRRYAAAQG